VAVTALFVAFTLAAGLTGFRLATADAQAADADDQAAASAPAGPDTDDASGTADPGGADREERPGPSTTDPTGGDDPVAGSGTTDDAGGPTTVAGSPAAVNSPPTTGTPPTSPPPPASTTTEPVPVTDPPPPPPPPLQLLNPGSQTSRIFRPVELALTVTGGTGEGLVFSAEGLPDGLDIDPSSGVVTGVPFDRETASVQATVTDSSGTSHSQGFTWVVEGRRGD
jgi:hypothetical protein